MIETAFKLLTPVIAQIFPDKKMQQEAQLKLLELTQSGELKKLMASKDIIVAEAQGEGWLQKNWRPLTMLTFVALIVFKWLGFTAPGITEALELKLLNIIQVGLGGYVVGRTGEKMMKEWKK